MTLCSHEHVCWCVSVCLFLVLCVSVPALFSLVDRYVLVGSRHGSWYEGALADWGKGSAVMTQIIASMTAQTRAGWQPDRTIVFCSWGVTSLGNIGSFEWGKVIFEYSSPSSLVKCACGDIFAKLYYISCTFYKTFEVSCPMSDTKSTFGFIKNQ